VKNYLLSLLVLAIFVQVVAPRAWAADTDAVKEFDIWSVIPADVLGVLVFQKPNEFDGKVAKLSASRISSIRLMDLLDHGLAIVGGMDDRGPIAFALLPPTTSSSVTRFAIFIPTVDRDSLMTLWDPRPIDDT